MLIEIALCGVAAFLFGRGIYHSGILTGWITEGLMSTRPKAPPPKTKPVESLAEILARVEANARKREAALFRDVPTAWWLDPARWGDAPRQEGFGTAKPSGIWCKHCSEGRYLRRGDTLLCNKCGDYRNAEPLAVEPISVPPCPSCKRGGQAHISIMAQHGDEASLLECQRCGCEYTPAGPTKRWRKTQRLAKSQAEMSPPAMPGQEPAYNPDPKTLPCGCPGNGSIERRKIKGGSTWTRCGRCQRWWEPQSNDVTGRWLGQGEHVHDRDDKAPDAVRAWANRLNQPSHGVCPADVCQFPVDKRDGLYYCTNTGCHHYDRGWK